MFSSNTSQVQGAGADPQFNYVTMLLRGDGTNGAQNNTFLDASTNNFTITRNGNTTQGTFSPYGSNWSNYFDGSSAYLATSSVTLSSDFTIETWVNQSSASQNSPQLSIGADTANSGTILLYLNTARQLAWYINNSTSAGSTAVSVGTWNHIAMVRSGSTITMYLNGVSQGTFSASTTISGVVNIASTIYSAVRYYGFGYASNVRITNTAVYTGNFTPTAAPLTAVTGTQLLTCQSNRFIDNSASPLTITVNGSPSVQRFSPFAPTAAYSAATIGGSGYFDGSGDFLSFSSASAVEFGTGDYTVEFWAYRTASATQAIVMFASNAYVVSINSSGGLYVYDGNVRAAGSAPLNAWNHYAACRSSGTLRLFVNGAQVYSDSSTENWANNSTLRIGSSVSGSTAIDLFTGYLSNLRIVKGTAVYTAAFTPPTAPVTAITNTGLLLNFTNAGIIDNAMMNDLETVGNAQISTSVKKYGTGSLKFDGSNDWLFVPHSADQQLGTGPFTIEMWVYPNTTGLQAFIGKGTAGSTGWAVGISSSSKAIFYYGSTSVSSSASLSASTWTHIAVVREGTGTNQTKIYINGVNDGTATVSTDFTQTNALYIGTGRGGSGDFNGYIDDLRITKGYARYTANFTPPTAAFPNN